ncbi:MAG: carbohydrate binding family 9 domain-containing protein [Firmicutes bacterium]|nr:carbohydrate binding family 9 domain-containing protein [Bacillota bacterium]
MKRRWFKLGMGCAALGLLGAEPTPLQAHRTRLPVVVDGKLSEAAWFHKPMYKGCFTQSWPEYGKPATLETSLWVIYDDRFLYVAARMHHPKGQAKVIHRLHRRDQDSASDWFRVYIDSLKDRRTALGFAVNAAGVQRDTLHVGDQTSGDASWDGVWESAVSRDENGWTAELKIPLSLLRIQPGGGPQTWGINFSRSDQGPVREYAFLALPPRGTQEFVSYFPELVGIEDLQPRPRREITPYVSAQWKAQTTRPFDDRGFTWRAGFDASLGLTSASQLNLTVYPDFGQVEVDQAVLNLSTSETYFPEKRPFFLEGMELFQVAGNTLFYSRRVGRGLGDPPLDAGEALLDRPQATDIQGAVKYTGKFSSGLQIGVLGASVAPTHAQIRTAQGEVVSRELSPTTGYGVMRAQQLLDERGSFVGLFAGFAQAASGRQGQTQALDGAYKSADRSTTVEMALARSHAGPEGDQATGMRERLRLNQQWKSGWRADLTLVNTERTYQPNDLGYLDRPDERIVAASTARRWDQTSGIFRNWEWGVWSQESRNQEGRTYQRGASTWFRTDFTNFFSFRAETGLNLPVEDDRELRTFWNPVRKYLRVERRPWGQVGFDSPGNRLWYVNASLSRSWYSGGPSTAFSFYQNLKLTSALEVQLDTRLSRDEGILRYLETQGETPVVGQRSMSLFNQTVRVAYAFSPGLSLQFFTQLLAATWAFREVQAYVDDDTLTPAMAQGPTALSDRLWNVNLIGRWEFRPGSTVFLVYTRGAHTSDPISPGNIHAPLSPVPDLAILRTLPADEALQVKVSWLFR